MIPIIVGTVVAAGSSLAASIIVKATATSAIALVTARLARKSRASALHLVFVAAFVTLLIIPIATIGLPALEVPLATGSAAGQAIGPLSAVYAGPSDEVKSAGEEINPPIHELPISKNALLVV